MILAEKMWNLCLFVFEQNRPRDNNNNLFINSALFNMLGDQKHITTINNLKNYTNIKKYTNIFNI